MEPWGREFAGRIDEHVFTSRSLAGNKLGDPAERPLWVYTPPGYDGGDDRRYPSVYVIQGLTGQIDMWRNRAAFRPNYLELMDDLFAGRQAPPAIVVFVDAWTSLGGSQFLNSTGTGRYHDYLCEELVPFVDQHYRTDPRPARKPPTWAANAVPPPPLAWVSEKFVESSWSRNHATRRKPAERRHGRKPKRSVQTRAWGRRTSR